jgi:hypothetical protein
VQLADAVADMQAAREQLARQVGRKRYVEVNFAAFEQFARDLQSQGVALVVFEGTSHPEVLTAYPPELRVETGNRLRELASRAGFSYLPATALPTFGPGDFSDPYHLSAAGRERFTRWLAEHLSTLEPAAGDHPNESSAGAPGR